MILIVHVQTEASASNIVDTCEDGELLLLSLAIHFMYTSSVISYCRGSILMRLRLYPHLLYVIVIRLMLSVCVNYCMNT